MFRTQNRDRNTIAVAVVAATLAIVGAGCGSAMTAEDYASAVEESQTELDHTIQELFGESGLEDVEEIFDSYEVGDVLDDEEVARVRAVVHEFWAKTFEASAIHHDDVADLEPPEAIEEAHDAYEVALAALVELEPSKLQDVADSSAGELIDTFWDPMPEIAAIESACRDLIAVLADEGASLVSTICSD